ncbi:MAG TPA: DUF2207 domain-containing protein [Patescibacteria group bacterium]|nr:DUF2207 domain-containing protein [Patescibacteria group bacterium]
MKKIVASLVLFAVLLIPLSVGAVSSVDEVNADISTDPINLENIGVDTKTTTPGVLNRDQIYDWYIKDFQTDITVNKDSSLDITEKIVADCGDLPNKHGIFRVLPTFYSPKKGEKVEAYIDLISITDFNGKPYNYSTTNDKKYETVTWKIGDADKTVTGVNNYQIKYHVRNTIRFDNPAFDEFYWNVNGAFWDIEIDHFLAKVIFPSEINEKNVLEINKYEGSYGSKDIGLSDYKWVAPNIIQVESKKTLEAEQGITLSVAFPKNIISPPVLTFWEQYGDLIFGLIILFFPVFVFIICFRLWWRYGRDPKLHKSITPEFAVPNDLTPMELGAFLKNAELPTSSISAEIVNLAVKGIIKIEEIPKKGIFSSADTKLIIVGSEQKVSKITEEDQLLLASLFGVTTEGAELLVSSLKDKFYKKLPAIKNAVKDKQIKAGLFSEKGFSMRDVMLVIGILAGMGSFFLFSFSSAIAVSGLVSAFFMIIFAVFMPRRTDEGADLLWRIRGFELYMKTAEKYRQKYNEKENIFERFLPYAMVFGIVDLWTRKMKEIYGENYFDNYHPVWYVGAFNLDNGIFNVDSFTNQLNSISSSMSSSMSSSPSSSGSGGGGFSGGGGGGGGGGGW